MRPFLFRAWHEDTKGSWDLVYLVDIRLESTYNRT